MSTTWPQLPLPSPAHEGLVSDNLVYRCWQEADAPSLVRAWEEPAIRQWTGVPEDCSLQAALRWLRGEEIRRVKGLAVDVVVECEGTLAGEVGLSSFNARRRAAVIGYWLHPQFRGRGLAVEAVQAVTHWAASTMALRGLLAVCAPANEGSIHVVQKAGYEHAGSDAQGNSVMVWRAEKPLLD